MTEKNSLSSSLAKRDKKEKLIIYFVGAAVLLFALVGLKEISQSNPYLNPPIWFGVLCSIFTLWRFCKKQKENPFASIFKTLKDDYVFDKYITLQLFNIFYALGQGLGVGASFGFFVDWVHALLSNSYLKNIYLTGFIACLLFVVILRVTIEVYSIIYKAAIEFRDYMKSKQ
tara:strand:+ start:3297 stop:3812 length:516 start_codon:yes stop_codon:yes gene_type:complete